MQSRLALIMMSVAGTAALFGIGFLLGLGVMSTPNKPEQHKQIALTTTPTKVTRSETTGSGKPDNRALTPLAPVAPGGAAAQAATPAPAEPQNEQASAKPAAQPAPAPQPQQTAAAVPPAPAANGQPKAQEPARQEPKPQVAKVAPAPAPAPVPAQTAKAEPASAAQPAPAANATPVSLERRNACDVSACSRAYRSFRESDCTYQPFSGPRQVCTGAPGGAKDAARERDDRQAQRGDDNEPWASVRVHRPGRDVELSNVAHEVERITDGRRARDDDERAAPRGYHRDFTADGEDDRIEPADGGGRRGFFFDRDDDDDQ